jgi:putative spermidine/putrescine transport system permease protein
MLLSPTGMGWGRTALAAWTTLVCAFLLLPILFVVALSFDGSRWLAFPPPSWTTRWYLQVLDDPDWLRSARQSLAIAVMVTVASVLLGVPAAFAIVRGSRTGRAVVRGFLMMPMVMPVIIVGVALYAIFLRLHLTGGYAGFVLAHLVLALPFTVLSVANALTGFDPAIERAAVICGASPVRAVLSVTLPSIAPGILAGALLAFLTSWDEVVVSIFMANADLQTLPVRVWATLRLDLSPVVAAVTTLLLAVSLLVLAGLALLGRRRP